MATLSTTPPSKFALLIAALLAITLFINNHSVSLWDEDEAAYAGFAQQMVETGNWVTPSYPKSVIHRKTPLHFWAIGGSYQLFGLNEFALRFSSALAILLTCLLVYFGTRSWLGNTVAERAAVILATSIQLPLMGKIAFTDATLLLFETGAVLALLRYLQAPNWRWNVLLWSSIALGVLTKGPPILVLTGGIWLLLAIFHPQRKRLIGTHPWLFGLLALLPFAYWAWLSYQQDYALWSSSGMVLPFEEWWNQTASDGRKIYLLPFLWDWYVLKRVGGSVLGQSGFPGYHFLVLTIAFLTWLPFWPMTLRALGRGLFGKTALNERPLVCWIVLGWFFWELMRSKLPSYALAAQPALALLMALQMERLEKQKELPKIVRFMRWVYLFLFIIISIGLPIAGTCLLGLEALWSLLPLSFVLLIMLVQQWQEPTSIKQLYQSLALFGAAFMLGIWLCLAPVVERSPIKSLKKIVEKAAEVPTNPKTATLYFTGLDVKQFKISLLFYAEQQFGQYEITSLEDAASKFQGTEPFVVLVGAANWEVLQNLLTSKNVFYQAERMAYRSTDDQLRRHDCWIVSKQ